MKFLKKISQTVIPHKPLSLLGFDMGTYSIKLAEVFQKKDEIILNGFSQVKTFENTVINQIVKDEQLLTTNIKNLLANFNPHSNRAYLSLPYEIIIYGKFTINNPESAQVIEKQINDEIPYKIEDVYFSYFIIPEKGSHTVYYLVSKKDNIEKIQNIFLNLNIRLENIDADFINLHNFLEFLYGPENKVIVDWGNDKIKLYFSNKEVPVYTRELFNLGFKQLKSEIQKEFKVTYDMAERYIHNPPSDNRRKIIKDLLKEYIKRLVDEIKFGIEIARSKYNLNPEIFYIIGGGARLPGIHRILSELLKIEVREIKIEQKIKLSENIDPQYLEVLNTQGLLSIATAVKEFI